jgi:hypothetical protein
LFGSTDTVLPVPIRKSERGRRTSRQRCLDDDYLEIVGIGRTVDSMITAVIDVLTPIRVEPHCCGLWYLTLDEHTFAFLEPEPRGPWSLALAVGELGRGARWLRHRTGQVHTLLTARSDWQVHWTGDGSPRPALVLAR